MRRRRFIESILTLLGGAPAMARLFPMASEASAAPAPPVARTAVREQATPVAPTSRPATVPAEPPSVAAPAAAPARTILLQHSRLAGFQYHEADSVWPWLRIGDTLKLVREPRNRYDGNAVRVDWKSVTLGYVPRVENHAVAQLLDRDETLTARITALAESPDPWQRVRFAVWLEAQALQAPGPGSARDGDKE
jgi:hypothetical protein